MADSGGALQEKSDACAEETVVPPDWLPEGWTMEVKTRKRGSTAGMKDRYYKDPVTGCKFRSKCEVLNYLQSGKLSDHTSHQEKVCTNTFTTNGSPLTVDLQHSKSWLPVGWITEIKTRKNGRRAGDVYKCYIAPFTGYKFYSKREVFCYLETGKLHGRITGRKKRSANSLPGTVKRKNLVNNTTRRCLFGSQSFNSDGTAPLLIDGSQLAGKCLQIKGPDLNQCVEDTELSILSFENTNHSNTAEGKSFPANLLQKKSPESENRKFSENGVPLEFESKNKLEVANLETEDLKPSKNVVQLESEYGKLPENGVLLEFKNKKQLEDVMSPVSNDKKPSEVVDRISFGNGVEEQRPRRVRHQASKPRCKRTTLLPCRASKRLAELKAKLEVDSGVDPTTDACDALENNHNGNPPWEEPPIGKNENEPVTPIVLPFGDSWPDPCLEFAFKTLTGAIPVVEDICSMGDSPQQLSVAQTQSFGSSDGSLPRFFCNEVESAGNSKKEREAIAPE